METSGVCELDVATRRIVGGDDSPPDLDSPSQVSTDGSSFVLLLVLFLHPVFPTSSPPSCPLGGGVSLFSLLKKDVVLLMQALNSLTTPEEKLAALCKKYADLVSQISN
uniref:Uncharacterized protein n=1 Tax=Amphilophus citrinellus TaxID=61819 RepID=A0A3Q0T2H2_AMPCI